MAISVATYWAILRHLWIVLVIIATISFLHCFVESMVYLRSEAFEIVNEKSLQWHDILAALYQEYGADFNFMFVTFWLPYIFTTCLPRHQPRHLQHRRIFVGGYIVLYMVLWAWTLSRRETMALIPPSSSFFRNLRSDVFLTKVVWFIDWQRKHIWAVCFMAQMAMLRKERLEADAMLELQRQQRMESMRFGYPEGTTIFVGGDEKMNKTAFEV